MAQTSPEQQKGLRKLLAIMPYMLPFIGFGIFLIVIVIIYMCCYRRRVQRVATAMRARQKASKRFKVVPVMHEVYVPASDDEYTEKAERGFGKVSLGWDDIQPIWTEIYQPPQENDPAPQKSARNWRQWLVGSGAQDDKHHLPPRLPTGQATMCVLIALPGQSPCKAKAEDLEGELGEVLLGVQTVGLSGRYERTPAAV